MCSDGLNQEKEKDRGRGPEKEKAGIDRGRLVVQIKHGWQQAISETDDSSLQVKLLVLIFTAMLKYLRCGHLHDVLCEFLYLSVRFDLIYGSVHIRPSLSLLLDWCMPKLAVIKIVAFFFYWVTAPNPPPPFVNQTAHLFDTSISCQPRPGSDRQGDKRL